ncbi:MAG: hypothetical protein IJQ34_04520 [Kiritimatiellae bacterium]|nr:hypothetical protein [Kiritimatiellia bacterium]
MICELCHKKKAEEAIAKSDEGEELYLCRDCARKENLRREKLRQETPNDSVVEIENGEGLPEDAPPIIRSIVEAVSDIFHDISNLAEKSETKDKKNNKEDFLTLKPRQKSPFIVNGRIHLAGLHLMGELEAAIRGVEALGLKLEGINEEGASNLGQMFSLKYRVSDALPKRALAYLLTQENNACRALIEDYRIVAMDAFSRALATLKNCYMLSPGEWLDLLSPMLFAARIGALKGVIWQEIAEMMKEVEFNESQEDKDAEILDIRDMGIAREARENFAHVKIVDAFYKILED